MTVALTDGPLGLEALHVWTPADGGPAITLNNLAAVPRVEFDRMTGFRSLPDADDNRQARTAQIGESALPGLVRGKTFTPEGHLVARSMQALRQLGEAMRAAFGQRDLEGTWSAIPDPAYGDNTHFWQCTARVLQLDIDEELLFSPQSLPSPYQLHFLLGLRMSDPRFTWTDVQDTGTDPVSVIATNLGTAPAEPTITVPVTGTTGSHVDVSVFNDTADWQLTLLNLPYTGDLVCDFAARTLMVGTHDVSTYVDTFASTWRDRGKAGLARGANTIRQTGGSSIQVTFRHTSW